MSLWKKRFSICGVEGVGMVGVIMKPGRIANAEVVGEDSMVLVGVARGRIGVLGG
eukprot:CAMPEP_0172519314 /NCGR_PEP_ID=MMETSP1066-20121228/291344_1 /TAXON_ID=671091 /ORGANISM="Coscinodiscus wailesii, Strain CCMP2513" /LENGTH=54 /DNA_ID=CAMNT_0013301881 /DNA_START=594 /DNA_END=758 /DNA_ORIENTATION=-